ncbi:MAG: heme-binding protein [Lachnospiraceae bacterium]|nr:heme-binding protein [Lachnospiraceae bacterium]
MLGESPQSASEPLFELSELIAQEEKYQFDCFTQKNVRRMGEIMLSICDEYSMDFAIAIYLNGITVFKYLPEGTKRTHDIWLEKKINTVMTMGWSTMRTWAFFDQLGNKRKPEVIPSGEIVFCGGGFPINVKGAGVIGVLAASGPGDQNDHEFLIEALKRYFEEQSR